MTNDTSSTVNTATHNVVVATHNVSVWKDKAIGYIVEHSGQLLGAIIIFVIGIFAARWIGRLTMKWLSRKEFGLEPPVRMLIVRITRLFVLIFAVVIALGTLQVNIGPIIAVIGVGGVGIGLAMQGVLSNLMAGLTIIFTKPFRVGEYIEMLGVHGQVQTIELFSTTLFHPDQSRVVIPNRKIIGEVLHNYGTVRQLDLSVGVAYGTNLAAAIELARTVVRSNTRVLKELNPAIGVTTLGDSSVNIAIRPWVNVPDYGAATAEIYQAIVEQFRASNIEIPFPQREIRLLNAVETGKPI
jgi:small conductance mechanosensitive channel